MTAPSRNQWCTRPDCPTSGNHYHHDGLPVYDREHLPDGPWCTYRKTALTKMVRIDGPFQVMTDEGPLTCRDGFLAMDQRGYPYPLAADEQALIYEPVETESLPQVDEDGYGADCGS